MPVSSIKNNNHQPRQNVDAAVVHTHTENTVERVVEKLPDEQIADVKWALEEIVAINDDLDVYDTRLQTMEAKLLTATGRLAAIQGYVKRDVAAYQISLEAAHSYITVLEDRVKNIVNHSATVDGDMARLRKQLASTEMARVGDIDRFSLRVARLEKAITWSLLPSALMLIVNIIRWCL